MDIISSLIKFGLKEKEAKTYIAALELGESTANEISIKSHLPRTLVYDLLEKLINLSLINHSIKNNKRYFIAAKPRRLLEILNDKKDSINNIIPSLTVLENLPKSLRPKVEIYSGKEGMKTTLNELLNSDIKEFICYGSSRSSYELIPAFMEEWHKKRIKKKILFRVIYNDTSAARKKAKNFKASLSLTKYRFMPIKLESPTATIIFGDVVLLQSWTKDPFTVKIASKEMADNQRKYFDELWKIAKP